MTLVYKNGEEKAVWLARLHFLTCRHGAQLFLEWQAWGKITGFLDVLLLHQKKLPSASECKQPFVQSEWSPLGRSYQHWMRCFDCEAVWQLLQLRFIGRQVSVISAPDTRGACGCRCHECTATEGRQWLQSLCNCICDVVCVWWMSHTLAVHTKADTTTLGAVSGQQKMLRFLLHKVNQKYLSEVHHSHSVLVICTCHKVALRYSVTTATSGITLTASKCHWTACA